MVIITLWLQVYLTAHVHYIVLSVLYYIVCIYTYIYIYNFCKLYIYDIVCAIFCTCYDNSVMIILLQLDISTGTLKAKLTVVSIKCI